MSLDDYLTMLHELPCAASMLIEGKRVKCQVVHHIKREPSKLEHYFGVPLLDKYHSPYSPLGLHYLSARGFFNKFKVDEMDLLAMTAKLVAEHLGGK